MVYYGMHSRAIMSTQPITLQTIVDADTGLTLGDIIHLEVEHTLAKLGVMKTYSEEEARKLLLETDE